MIAENAAVFLNINQGAPPLVRLRGKVAPQNAREILDAFRTLSASQCERVHVDAAEVSDMDASCINALVQGVNTLRQHGIAVKLVGRSPRLSQLLSDFGLSAPPEKAAARGHCRMELPCMPQSVALIRASVTDLLRGSPFDPAEEDDIVLAVGEAAANAVRHGRRLGNKNRMQVRCRLGRRTFSVTITDPGAGFDPEQVRPPKSGAFQENGLGIYLMRRIMDAVSYTFDARGTTVRLVKCIRQTREAAPAR